MLVICYAMLCQRSRPFNPSIINKTYLYRAQNAGPERSTEFFKVVLLIQSRQKKVFTLTLPPSHLRGTTSGRDWL